MDTNATTTSLSSTARTRQEDNLSQATKHDWVAAHLIDIPLLAARLGVTERFVRRLVHERRIPFHKIGKFVRFRPDDVECWINDQRIENDEQW